MQLSDEIYELHRPTQGHPKLEIVCCHGFQKEDYDQDAYLRTWMTADGSECWLMTWLPQALPPCRILSVSYDSCVHISSSRGRMDLYLLGENLAYALIMLANVGQSCPVLLVGHCVGGLVLKQVCIQAQRLGIQFRGPGVNPHSTFLNHMKGIFFYATPHLGSKTVEKLTQRSPLVEYLIVYCKETARINQEFSELRQRHRWVAVGVSEGAETVDCNTIVPGSQRDIFAQFGLGERSNATSTLIVEEASARFESEEFSILPEEDHFSICRQKSKQSNSFLRLLTLVDQVMQSEEIGEQIFYRTLRYTTKSFVDMSGRVENIIRNLKLDQASSSSSSGSSSTQLALVGMSGIGKTTLAKEVFISIKSRFDFICFIEDVSDKLKSRELSELMAMHLFHGNGRTPYLQGGCSAAAHSIWYLLKGRKVLLILDGVEDMKKIDPLLALDWCSDGSRLIITTCIHSPELIQSHFLIHNVSLLSKVEARRLFRMCLQNNVLQEIPEHLVHAVVRFCDGLPLLVLVLGGYLSSIKQEYIWEGVLRKLERAESIGDDQEKLIGKLRLSFLGLNETEKMIFLDLTLFDGLYDLELLIPAWESILSRGVVEINLEQLMRKSLLICDHDVRCWFQRPEKRFDAKDLSRVKVHRQLREMGWSLLRPASETAVELCKGIWQLQDVEKLLTQKARKSEVEVISLERSDTLTNHRRLQVNWDRIGRLGKLRFLQLKNVNFVGCCNLRFPFDLCLLHLINCSRESESVNKRWPWEWVVMESTSCWPLREQDRQGLKKLAVLLLEHCRSVRLPTNFHHLENLKVLRIQAKDVTHLPPLFGHLPSLQSLFLNCPNLQQLPPSFLHLPELRELKLMGCSALNSLPVFFLLDGFSSNSPRLAFAPLANLTDLCIVRASSLTELPDSFGQLKSLQRLVIDECRALKKLPEGFGDLQQLESLKIIWCKELRYLCQSFGHLDSLRELDIGECFNLQGLPHSFGHMKALRTLRIDSCNALNEGVT
ncbi:hypothetical protein R1sor_002098 [Riccia sorocarpa]|uniref:NB-ARC domain-containing protein n=1 Tax=Riccia sorocarpa TaxID=122646 RepID=A0ABD3GZT3_9MARC